MQMQRTAAYHRWPHRVRATRKSGAMPLVLAACAPGRQAGEHRRATNNHEEQREQKTNAAAKAVAVAVAVAVAADGASDAERKEQKK